MRFLVSVSLPTCHFSSGPLHDASASLWCSGFRYRSRAAPWFSVPVFAIGRSTAKLRLFSHCAMDFQAFPANPHSTCIWFRSRDGSAVLRGCGCASNILCAATCPLLANEHFLAVGARQSKEHSVGIEPNLYRRRI
ncbi:hypothetical protein PLICRDRAFT_259050 [Plicaturopsis crispa FD-325 SS-3]|nr:hypothetical protein PLICRDRAFT_259050 [Plicaturopsis crispa FD-325 SS-3]